MTQEQKNQAKEIFIACWNDPTISSKDLHTEIQIKLVEEGIIAPSSVLTEDSVRKSFEKIGEGYVNYRKRPRKEEGLVFDFDSDSAQIEIPVENSSLDF